MFGRGLGGNVGFLLKEDKGIETMLLLKNQLFFKYLNKEILRMFTKNLYQRKKETLYTICIKGL